MNLIIIVVILFAAIAGVWHWTDNDRRARAKDKRPHQPAKPQARNVCLPESEAATGTIYRQRICYETYQEAKEEAHGKCVWKCDWCDEWHIDTDDEAKRRKIRAGMARDAKQRIYDYQQRETPHKFDLYKHQDGICAGCHIKFPERNLTVDHIHPRSLGGGDEIANLQLLCNTCNSIKGNRPMEYLRARLREQSQISGGDIHARHKSVLYEKQNGICAGCHREFPKRNFEIDHIRPRSQGGENEITNLQLLCGACNSLKGDRDMDYLRSRLYLQGIIR